jgi:hypothetical protein
MLLTLYSTGLRRAELTELKVEDIDSQRMMIRVRQGKGRHDRDVPLSSKLLEVLREYWRWKKPQCYLFPSDYQKRAGQPVSDKVIWWLCKKAAREAGIKKRVSPHTCAIAMRLICWKQARIYGRSRFCSAIRSSRTPPSTFICLSGISLQLPIRWTAWKWTHWRTCFARGNAHSEDRNTSCSIWLATRIVSPSPIIVYLLSPTTTSHFAGRITRTAASSAR